MLRRTLYSPATPPGLWHVGHTIIGFPASCFYKSFSGTVMFSFSGNNYFVKEPVERMENETQIEVPSFKEQHIVFLMFLQVLFSAAAH
jgi:hypothetical protein